MANVEVQFDVHHSLTNEYIATLEFTDWSLNDPLRGVGGFTGDLPVRSDQVDFLREATTPHTMSLYARVGDTYIWGGPILARPWSRSKSALEIIGMQWEGWLYQRLLQDKYIRKNADQFSICRSLVGIATSDSGCPSITLLAQPSSRLRDLTVDPWNSIGEALDRISNRDPAFDWGIQIRKHVTTGLPELYLALWYPERQSLIDPHMHFESVSEDDRPTNGNAFIDVVPDDGSDLITRQWATGEGTPPDQPSASDEDPSLTMDGVLLTESVTNYSGVISRVTLFEHASEERRYRGAPVQTIPIEVKADTPSVETYLVGDRVRLVMKDKWIDQDYPAVRIIDRAIRFDRQKGTSVTLVLDLNDFEAPSTNEGEEG